MNGQKMMITLVLLASLAGFAKEATQTPDGEALKIEVPAGETNEVSSVDLTGITDIRKIGLGGVIMNADLSSYEGDIHIDEGTWRFVNSKGLGKLAANPGSKNNFELNKANGVGQVWVKSGATLEACSNTKNGLDNRGKIIHFGGTGVNGIGALVWNSKANQTYAFGCNLVMTDDALIHGLHDFSYYVSASDVRLTMGKHTLTVVSEYLTAPITFTEVRTLAEDSGDIVLNGKTVLMLQNYQQFLHANVRLYVNDESRIDELSVGGSLSRTLVWNSTGTNFWYTPRMPPQYSSRLNNWTGAVQLQNGKTMTTYGSSQFLDQISGDGGLCFCGAVPLSNPTNYVVVTGENTFTGPFSVWRANLTLGAKSVQNITSFTAENSDVAFAESDYTLPTGVISVATANVVTNGTGSWRHLVKKGAGTLDYASQIGAGTLDVQEGAVRLHANPVDLSKYAGAIEGVGYYNGTTKLYADADKQLAYRHRVAPGITEIYTSHLTPMKNAPAWFADHGIDGTSGRRYLITYSGYIWNHSSENVTWTFAGCLCIRCEVCIDGERVFLGTNAKPTLSDNKPSGYGFVTLTPGPHTFYAYCTHSLKDGGSASACPNFFIQYDPQGRDPMSSGEFDTSIFRRIVNQDGEPPLLTWGKPGEDLSCLIDEQVYDRKIYGTNAVNWVGMPGQLFDNLKFGAGAGIDLDGSTNILQSLTGWPTVANGSRLHVEDTWTVSTDDLKAGGAINVSELSFGEDAEFVIEDLGKIRGTAWTLATSVKEISGTLQVKNAADLAEAGWTLTVGKHSVTLNRRPPGLLMIIK